jgi:hypothetical protein
MLTAARISPSGTKKQVGKDLIEENIGCLKDFILSISDSEAEGKVFIL